MPQITRLLAISRPRFWIYLLGPFLIGSLGLVKNQEQLIITVIGFIFFTFPANLLVYGINDLYDQDTDFFNLKKGTYEYKLHALEVRMLKKALFGAALIAFIYFLLLPFMASLYFLAFLFLAWSYSAWPIRFKSRTYLDSISNILYVLPGFCAYSVFSQQAPPLWILLACLSWTTAMHLFSAIPDIKADAQAGLATTAVKLGSQKSLSLTSILWLLSSLTVLFNTGKLFLPAFLLIYFVVPLMIIKYKLDVSRVYRIFPMLNFTLGFCMFWYLVITTYV